MGLFSVRGRLPQPTRQAVGKIGKAMIVASNDARVVAILLLLAAVALAVEMAASFHVI